MLSPVETYPVDHNTLTVPPELTAAVDEVYAELAFHGISSAFFAAGRLNDVRSFKTEELPEGACYIPYNPDSSDDVELPDFLPRTGILDNLTPDDERQLAIDISQKVGVAHFSASGVFKLIAPDVGVHSISFPDTQSGVRFLEQHGYRVVVPLEPSTESIDLSEMSTDEPERGWFTPVIDNQEPEQSLSYQDGEAQALIASESQNYEADVEYTPSMTEQYIIIRHALQSQLNGRSMRTELPVQYGLEQADVNRAFDAVLDIGLHNTLLDQGHALMNEPVFDKITSAVIKAALAEFVRLAPSGKEYDNAIREGLPLRGSLEAGLANQIRAMRGKMTICDPDSRTPERKPDIAPTQFVDVRHRPNSTQVFAPIRTQLAQKLSAAIPENFKPSAIKQKLTAILSRLNRKTVKA